MSNTNTYETIKKIANLVREQIMFESGDDPTGYCVEASEMIIEELKMEGLKAELIEGWVQYDDPSTCTDRDHDEHSWVECEGYIIDVTGDQFDYFMEEPMPPVYIDKEIPHGWFYDEPEDNYFDNEDEEVFD